MAGDALGSPSTDAIDVKAPRDRRGLRIVVAAGPDRGRSLSLKPFLQRLGKDPGCDLVLTDPTVSAVHLGVLYLDGRIHLRDLGSRNGSFHAGARFETLELSHFATIQIGRTELQIEATDAAALLPPSPRGVLHGLVGQCDRMRRMFTVLERVAPTDATVLIEGEPGTGKELVAAALHALSPRAARPFIVCDLASLSGNLAESDLFGHVRGAFTGADRDRAGAFELAHGGTIFLDEIGELPGELQPRLLRVLQERQVRRVGSNDYRKVDVRLIAATNRDLVDEVQAGRFRADLYHRLGTVSVHVPALRERPGDAVVLAEHFLAEAAATSGRPVPALDPEFRASLAAYHFPGNVRELRNLLERAVALSGPDVAFAPPQALGLPDGGPRDRPASAVDPAVPFHDAKGRLVDAWEREYLAALLASCDGNISLAARRGGLDRAYLYRLLKKHELT